ncbi:hypothetical protein [Streptomyces sp. NPDC018610]|uniref:hypothetical protein n=1 Tax=Streptomyces sp. NPDC018610 TaxID=3365049 RepID=UPI003787D6AB
MPVTLIGTLSQNTARQSTAASSGGAGEDQEAQVVDAHPAEHVAQPAQHHDQDRRDQKVAQDHPQQVADVARSEGVEADAPEDRGQ